MNDETVFDFVIAGGGSAGCVLANRLSECGRYRVALVEGGGRDNWIWFHIPVGYLFAIGNPRSDWMFRTEPVPGLNGRVLAYPRGKVLGGSSAINAMIYMRGQAADYDGWRQRGLVGWGWDDVLPFFKKHEDHWRGSSAFHGAGGEWRIEEPRVRWKVLDAFREAAGQAGIAASDDFNTGSNEGCGYFDVNQRRGRRWSAARGFLKPAMSRSNLTVMTGSRVERVLIEDGRAKGLTIVQNGQSKTLSARCEVVISTGAVATPGLLERSGIGDGERLAELGVQLLHHSPGVGENLQDHLQIRPIYKVENVATLNTQYRSILNRLMMGVEYGLFRRGAMTMAPSQLGAFARSSPQHETPNVQMHIQPLSLDKFGDDMHDFAAITASICNLRPNSRGSIHARSSRGEDAPVIQPNYLSDADDQQVAVESLSLVRKIMSMPAMAPYSPREFRPGEQVRDKDDLVKAAAELGTTIFHPVGTARMGPDSDMQSVVDARLRVKGVAGLRVVDASVMPTITSGNTNAPTMMIAEKGAGMILEDAL